MRGRTIDSVCAHGVVAVTCELLFRSVSVVSELKMLKMSIDSRSRWLAVKFRSLSIRIWKSFTAGSEYDPLPVGTWKVTGVSRNPVFHYNPKLFWDANPQHTKARIAAGPNNPVGVVWIDLDKEHYGLHGTPEPSKVGHAESHGCVRLTNWDAQTLAGLIEVGTPVLFVE